MYNHKEIEKKWQKKWEEEKIYQVDLDKAKKPFYNLMMFPYPSAEGLHVGNMYAFVHSDTYGRFRRLQGDDVFEPIGLDGFGIHSENYAIKIGEHIKKVSARTEKHFYEQLHIIGNAYDWSRTVETYKPNYYKWTQWLFLKMYEKGLAYRKKSSVNWCPSCKTVLSDEQVIAGKCERCNTETEKKEMEQWFWRITDYAEKLLKNLETIDWSEEVKTIQRNWIGRSEGAIIQFSIADCRLPIDVFTTRPDTLFGATYFVMSPEHPLVKKITTPEQKKAVEKYIEKTAKKSELERTDLAKEKTGVFTGAYAVNPVNQEKIPVWIADYVMASYGTGAIMAVPAHDERDWEFANKKNLPIKFVVYTTVDSYYDKDLKTDRTFENIHPDKDKAQNDFFTKRLEKLNKPYLAESGKLINSGKFTGLRVVDAKKKIIEWLEKNGVGKRSVNYKLRDWCVSRQRYWGPPIPMIECPKCGWVPVEEKDLPVLLPEMDDFLPDGSGKGPLNKVKDFVNTTCSKCGGPAKRETDVSDPFVDSCWYFMRYLCTEFKDKALDRKRLKKWLPVNMYIGGKEHSVLHLLYSRFMTMVMHELGYVPEEEPYKQFRAHGLLIAEGAKISKSKGNIINPDKYIEKFGADAVRMYLMFLGDMRQGGDWQDSGMNGVYRFLNDVYNYFNDWVKGYNKDYFNGWIKDDVATNKDVAPLLHKTIKKVTEDIEGLKFNTAISQLMILKNSCYEPLREGETKPRGFISFITKADFKKFLILLAPFAPHLAEELWHELGNKESVFKEKWPEYDKKLVKDETINLVVQINGKLRDTILVAADISEKEAREEAMKSEKIKKWLEGKEVVKIIFVKGRLINIVVK